MVVETSESWRAFAFEVAVALAGSALASATKVGWSGRPWARQVARPALATAVDAVLARILLVVEAVWWHADIGHVTEAEPGAEVIRAHQSGSTLESGVTVALASGTIATAAKMVSTGTAGAGVGTTTARPAAIDGCFCAILYAVGAGRGHADVVADGLVELRSDVVDTNHACASALASVVAIAFAAHALVGSVVTVVGVAVRAVWLG
jgi:hypothetical protein